MNLPLTFNYSSQVTISRFEVNEVQTGTWIEGEYAGADFGKIFLPVIGSFDNLKSQVMSAILEQVATGLTRLL